MRVKLVDRMTSGLNAISEHVFFFSAELKLWLKRRTTEKGCLRLTLFTYIALAQVKPQLVIFHFKSCLMSLPPSTYCWSNMPIKDPIKI